MKRFQILFSILVVVTIVFVTSCESKSGKRQKEITMFETVNDSSLGVVKSSYSEDRDYINVEENSDKEIIGYPVSLKFYFDEGDRWVLGFYANGMVNCVDITKETALKIINDTSVVAIKVKGKSVTLLKEVN